LSRHLQNDVLCGDGVDLTGPPLTSMACMLALPNSSGPAIASSCLQCSNAGSYSVRGQLGASQVLITSISVVARIDTQTDRHLSNALSIPASCSLDVVSPTALTSKSLSLLSSSQRRPSVR